MKRHNGLRACEKGSKISPKSSKLNETKRLYSFGPFRVDVRERTLHSGNQLIQLTPKVFDLLVLMVENPGHLLEKDDLLKTLWPETFVEDANLSVNVSTLRRALGESPTDVRYIETVPKRGYRFIANVSDITPAASADMMVVPAARKELRTIRRNRSWMLAFVATGSALLVLGVGLYVWSVKNTSGVADIHSLAVLPFSQLDGKPEDDYLGLGMADALINKLTNVRQITVRPTSAIQKYFRMPDNPILAGQQLQVDALLEGRIQSSGKMIRVSVQLLRVRDQAPLWAATFDDLFTNMFAVQDSVSEKLAAALSVRLTAWEHKTMLRRQTSSQVAYDLYVQGQYLVAKRTANDTLEAIQLFRRAIAKDPQYALPYAELASTYITVAGAGRSDAWENAEARGAQRGGFGRLIGRWAPCAGTSVYASRLELGRCAPGIRSGLGHRFQECGRAFR